MVVLIVLQIIYLKISLIIYVHYLGNVASYKLSIRFSTLIIIVILIVIVEVKLNHCCTKYDTENNCKFKLNINMK